MKLFTSFLIVHFINIYIYIYIGGYIFGSLADTYGRRGVLFWTKIITTILMLATTFAPTFTIFLILRFSTGITTGGTKSVIFAYFTEFQPKHRRGSMLSVLSIIWVIGYILSGALAWLIIPMFPQGLFTGKIFENIFEHVLTVLYNRPCD